MKRHEPLGNVSWFDLGAEIGLDVVSEDEVVDEGEAIKQTEEDKVVEVIFKSRHEKHDKFKHGKIQCINYMS